MEERENKKAFKRAKNFVCSNRHDQNAKRIALKVNSQTLLTNNRKSVRGSGGGEREREKTKQKGKQGSKLREREVEIEFVNDLT